MMRIGTGLGFSRDLNLAEGEKYKILAEVGFDCVDVMIEGSYRASVWQIPDHELRNQMETIRKNANQNGIIINQIHAPFDCVWSEDIAVREACWKAQIQAIKATAYLGATYMVMHPLTFGYRLNQEQYEHAKQKNIEYFSYLKPYLQEYDVKVAIENIFVYDTHSRPCKTNCSTARDLIGYVDALNSDCFGVCLDVGHAALVSQDPVEMIYALGKEYLFATHIHDNNSLSDDHMMPGYGKLDWLLIGRALKDIGYEGVFNYEADRPYFRLGEFRKELSLEFLKVYAELAKSITGV